MIDQTRSINPITYDMKSLRLALGCGRYTAEKIATAAGARIQIGKRVLYDAGKIRKYLDSMND